MSIFDFFKKKQPAPAICHKQRLDAEMLATLQADIARAQSHLDRMEGAQRVTITDCLQAAFDLRLAQVTLNSINERNN